MINTNTITKSFFDYFHFEKEDDIIYIKENIRVNNIPDLIKFNGICGDEFCLVNEDSLIFYKFLDEFRRMYILHILYNFSRRFYYQVKCKYDRNLYDKITENNQFNLVLTIKKNKDKNKYYPTDNLYATDYSLTKHLDHRGCYVFGQDNNFSELKKELFKISKYKNLTVTQYEKFEKNKNRGNFPKFSYLTEYELERNNVLYQFFNSHSEERILEMANDTSLNSILSDLDDIKVKVIALLENKNFQHSKSIEEEKNKQRIEIDDLKKELEKYKSNVRNNAEAISMMEKVIERNKELGLKS